MHTLIWFAGEFHAIGYNTEAEAKAAAQEAADHFAPKVYEPPVTLVWDKNNCVRIEWIELQIVSHDTQEAEAYNLRGDELFNELNIK